jgi:hypothetical protein
MRELIDYKIFVPRGAKDFIRLNGKEYLVDEIRAVNIHISDDKVVYWMDFRIDEDDHEADLRLKPKSSPNMVLLIGNNPYEIHGIAEVIYNTYNKWESKKAITISFLVNNASHVKNNPRKEEEINRSELLDI